MQFCNSGADCVKSPINTNMKQGGVRSIPWNQINTSTPGYADYSSPLKIFWINGWDSQYNEICPSKAGTFWMVMHIPNFADSHLGNDMSQIAQIWIDINNNKVYTRTYMQNNGWTSFSEK